MEASRDVFAPAVPEAPPTMAVAIAPAPVPMQLYMLQPKPPSALPAPKAPIVAVASTGGMALPPSTACSACKGKHRAHTCGKLVTRGPKGKRLLAAEGADGTLAGGAPPPGKKKHTSFVRVFDGGLTAEPPSSTLGRAVNFPSEGQVAAVKGDHGGSSRFKGVTWSNKCNAWEA